MTRPSKSFYDLLEPGMEQQLGTYRFTADEIVEFARDFDPQPFHLSEEEAAKSNFGSLCASGWHTLSVWMRMNVLNGRKELLRLTGYEGPPPVFGPSPGVRNIRWIGPVYAGDVIRFTSTLTAKRTTPKRPGWGLLTSHSQGFNESDALVVSMDGAVTLRTD